MLKSPIPPRWNLHPLVDDEKGCPIEPRASRLALAGGSDDLPPGREPQLAEIIRFPLERVRPGLAQEF
jgi:hypothetical protein